MIVLMAHYDHFGKMGKALFPGANDNASGVAMLLSLACYFSQHQPEYTTVFIAFGAEEIGLVGSKYFVEHPPFDLDKIKFLMNFDLAGTGDEGIQVVNGSVYQSEFDRLKALNSESEYLPQVKIRGSACNSDHCSFDQKGVPGFYIYTLGGIRAYHDIYDKYETLPFTEFEDYFQLVTEFLNGF
jgi:Zn-dependent M28 family amino/carboxypeptidase